MKITIYELLGMIKDGKAPKRIALRNEEYIYMEDARNYQCLTKPYEMMKIYDGWCLNEEVEILETTITYNQDNYYQYQPYTGKVEIKFNSAKNLLESDEIYNQDANNCKQDDISKLPYYDYSWRNQTMELSFENRKRLDYAEKRLNDYHEKINEIIDHLNNNK